MTAEIAILNKSAIALATDSAVTISAGNSHQKVFDTADKLFELSCEQPIGIMIYNGMQFAGIPLPDLIKEFRSKIELFTSVEEAANSFLSFLNTVGKAAPVSTKRAVIEQIVSPILSLIEERFQKLFRKSLASGKAGSEGDVEAFTKEIVSSVIAIFQRATDRLGPGEFVGKSNPKKLRKVEREWIEELAKERLHYFPTEYIPEIVALSERIVLSDMLSDSRTGIVIAGFGAAERFPTLISYEVEGVISEKLKFKLTSKCDIDRDGEKAFIRPFAQKEMVERFLYGLDEDIQNEILIFCKQTVGEVSKEILDRLTFENQEELNTLRSKTSDAEDAFLRNLKERAFKVIEERSRREVEDMIQFMPKPELAKMAEALVELTSMKRKVTVGVETVGGPVDVAVISKSEGFVWIKRKHYFPKELNARYFQRVGERRDTKKEAKNAT